MKNEPQRIDELILDLSRLGDPPPLTPAERIVLAEPMTRFACNQMGCCCGGWQVELRGHDLVRLGRRLDETDRARLTREVTVSLRRDPATNGPVLDKLALNDAEGTCRFLETDGRLCSVHRKYGGEALPEVCGDFPVVAHGDASEATLAFDPVCPSVLDRLAEDDGPLQLVTRTGPYDPSTASRASRPRPVRATKLGPLSLSPAQDASIRQTAIELLGNTRLPFWVHLHALEAALVRVVRAGDVDAFEPRPEPDPTPFLRHLGRCLATHEPDELAAMLENYRRFVFDLPLDGDPDLFPRLGEALSTGWPGKAGRTLQGLQSVANPLFVRWLANAMTRPIPPPLDDLQLFVTLLTVKLTAALRYASALSEVLERPVDEAIAKVALGAGEYAYRALGEDLDGLDGLSEAFSRES